MGAPAGVVIVCQVTLFPNASLDFVFIDADHSEASVQADILAWRPKLRPGGILAGHDWTTYGSVQQAVTALLGTDCLVEGNCWIHQAPI